MANDTQANIDATIESTSSPEQVNQEQAALAAEQRPKNLYRIDPKNKVPVSYYEGAAWKGRKTAGLKNLSGLFESWQEAESYYTNSQMEHRRATDGQWKGNDVVSKNKNRKFSSTENMVYSTVNAEIPSIYAKNPNVEITAQSADQEPIAVGLKHFINNLASRKDAPGINLKPKIRKSAMRASLMNEAWVMIGYTLKEYSADQAREDLARLAKELEEAKDEKEILRIEGELMALEESVDLLDPSGPFVKTVRGDQVIVDPASVEDDHSDANWIMVKMMLPTNYLNARFRQPDPKNPGQYVSAYQATHIVDAATQGGGVNQEQQEIDNFHIFDAGKDNPREYGYDNRSSYERAKMTSVWYCFDKIKRRFYMYADNDWTWPVWVYNDPYRLPLFFPLKKLMYHTDPKKNRTRGEASHYLDQQDELNTISDEMNRMRTICRDKVLFDPESLDQATVENIFLDPNRKAVAVKGLSERGVDKVIAPPPLPNMQYQHLWDRSAAMSVINQISGLGDAMRGEQFKTNTTNQAIEFYNSTTGVRLDEKRDAIEDFIGEICSDVIFLCLQFMPIEQMAKIAGPQYAQNFAGLRNMGPDEIRDTFNIRIAGGSTQKPTSSAKKAEALQIAQILGQFARSNPYAGILATKVMERAFDTITIEAYEWQMMTQMAMATLQQGNNNPDAGPGHEEPTGEGPDNEGGKDVKEDEDAMVQEIMKRAEQAGKPISEQQAREALRKRMH